MRNILHGFFGKRTSPSPYIVEKTAKISIDSGGMAASPGFAWQLAALPAKTARMIVTNPKTAVFSWFILEYLPVVKAELAATFQRNQTTDYVKIFTDMSAEKFAILLGLIQQLNVTQVMTGPNVWKRAGTYACFNDDFSVGVDYNGTNAEKLAFTVINLLDNVCDRTKHVGTSDTVIIIASIAAFLLLSFLAICVCYCLFKKSSSSEADRILDRDGIDSSYGTASVNDAPERRGFGLCCGP